MAHPADKMLPHGAGFPEYPASMGEHFLWPLIFFGHPVTNADLRKNIDWFRRIRLNLPPDICHIYPEDCIVIFRIRSPNMLNQPVIEQDFAGISGQKCNNLELVLGQMDFLTVPGDQTLFKVYGPEEDASVRN